MLLAAEAMLLPRKAMLLTPKSYASGEGTSYNVKNGEKFAGFKLKLYLCIQKR